MFYLKESRSPMSRARARAKTWTHEAKEKTLGWLPAASAEEMEIFLVLSFARIPHSDLARFAGPD